MEIGNLILKFEWKCKGIDSQKGFEKEVGELILPDFKTCQATEIKAA